MELRKYTIITSKQVYNTEDPEEILEEQDKKMRMLELNRYETEYLCHFFNSVFFDEFTETMTIDDAIQMLAIKDGVDMVKFDDGCYGFVSYYNNHETGFEILRA